MNHRPLGYEPDEGPDSVMCVNSSSFGTGIVASTILNEPDYTPHDTEVVIANRDSNRHKFTGNERDSESGRNEF